MVDVVYGIELLLKVFYKDSLQRYRRSAGAGYRAWSDNNWDMAKEEFRVVAALLSNHMDTEKDGHMKGMFASLEKFSIPYLISPILSLKYAYVCLISLMKLLPKIPGRLVILY